MEYIKGVFALLFFPLFIGSMLLVAFWEKDAERSERRESPKEKGQPRVPPQSPKDDEDLPYKVLGININADGYEILGVSRRASKQDVDSAFKEKQQGWHPDKFPAQSDKKMANAVSKILNNARDQIYRQSGWK
jgi:DnaJ-domain-containing protein 1